VKLKRSSQREGGRSTTQGDLSRRRFGQLAMLGLAGGALMPAELLLADGSDNGRATEGKGQESATLAARAQAEVDAKVKAIFAEYGDRLSEEQKKRMRGIVSSHVQMLESVRAFPLQNPDAPATVLKLATRSENRAGRPERKDAGGVAGKSSRRGRKGEE
jgi:hypothetical protein